MTRFQLPGTIRRRGPSPVVVLWLALPALLAVAALPAAAPAQAVANEAGLLAVWEQHAASPGDHGAAITACRAFLDANPGDPLVPVVHGLEAWHLFQEQRRAEATQLLAPYLVAASDETAQDENPVRAGARMIAHGWMTRLDRERVADSLQAYYRKEVAYPEKLAGIAAHPRLPKSAHPPMTDRFGNEWQYRLTGFGKLSGFENQRYELASSTLGDSSDYAAALELPYAAGIKATPVSVMDRASPLVSFKTPGDATVSAASAGQKAAGLHLAFVGSRIIVVCDHSSWKVFPDPDGQ